MCQDKRKQIKSKVVNGWIEISHDQSIWLDQIPVDSCNMKDWDPETTLKHAASSYILQAKYLSVSNP